MEDAPAPGWYPDPRDERLLRWWDGASWTTSTRHADRLDGAGEIPDADRSIQPPGDAAGARPTAQKVADPRSRPGIRRVVVAIAAVALLAGGVIIGRTLTGGDEQTDSADTTPAATSEEPEVVDVDELLTTTVLARDWHRAEVELPDQEASGDGATTIYAVVQGGPGWVAVGGDGRNGAVWVSEDARTWTRVEHDPSVFGGEFLLRLTSVITGGPGLVAVGWDGFPPAGGESRAVVLTSQDGLSWERVPHDPAVFGDLDPGNGLTAMFVVADTGQGLIAAGQAPAFDTEGRIVERQAAFWTSDDGVSWSRLAADRRTLGGDGDQLVMSIATDENLILAVGTDALVQLEHGGPEAWLSSDGTDWDRVRISDHVRSAMVDVVAYAGGFVAVGVDLGDGSQSAAVWRSPDGRSWSRVTLPREAPNGSLSAVATSGRHLMAVGENGTSGSAAVWTSNDGQEWQLLPQLPEASFIDADHGLMDVAIAEDTVVVAGRDVDGPAVWLLPPDGD